MFHECTRMVAAVLVERFFVVSMEEKILDK